MVAGRRRLHQVGRRAARGGEADVTLTRGVGRHVKLTGGYGHFAPGAFLRQAASGAAPVDWGFLSTTMTF